MLFSIGAAKAGMVQTFADRLEGKVAIQKDHVTVGDKKVAWNDVLYLLPDNDAKVVQPRQRVRLKNGEAWAADIMSFSDQKIGLRSELFGAKQIDVRLIAGLEFAPAASGRVPQQLGTLYRVKGEPVAGKLLGLTADKIKIDSVVGELDLPRDTAVSYRFAETKPGRKPGDDELTLIDGSRYRGILRPGPYGVLLEHASLGELKVPASILRGLVRSSNRVLDLTEAKPGTLRSTPLVPTRSDTVPAPDIVDGDTQSAFVTGLRIEPNLTAEYRIAGPEGKKGRLRAVLAPVMNAAGDVHITIKIDGKVMLEREIAPKSRLEVIALNVASGNALEIAVDFGGTLRFPCGVVLGDPHVIWD